MELPFLDIVITLEVIIKGLINGLFTKAQMQQLDGSFIWVAMYTFFTLILKPKSLKFFFVSFFP
jgi:hypothetical protein